MLSRRDGSPRGNRGRISVEKGKESISRERAKSESVQNFEPASIWGFRVSPLRRETGPIDEFCYLNTESFISVWCSWNVDFMLVESINKDQSLHQHDH